MLLDGAKAGAMFSRSLNSLCDLPLFQQCLPYQTLQRLSLGFVDVGARGGVHEAVLPLARLVDVLAFEADPVECQTLVGSHEQAPVFQNFDALPLAVAENGPEVTFQVLSGPLNSSLLTPNPDIVERYRLPGFEVRERVTLPADSLDGVIFAPGRSPSAGEFLKLDAQGGELAILKGATRTLAERSVAVIAEVEFCPLYDGQPLFSEVEQFMRGQGFAFYGFLAMSYRSVCLRDLLGCCGAAHRERLIHADAVFFKDGLLQPRQSQLRAAQVLFAVALMLGYHDFALEVANRCWAKGEELQRIESLARDLAIR